MTTKRDIETSIGAALAGTMIALVFGLGVL